MLKSQRRGKAIVASIVLGGLGVGAYIAPWDYWLGIEEEEDAAVFNTSHYINGVNTAFEKADAIELFAGGEEGGGGRFEDVKERDIAKSKEKLIQVLKQHGLKEGSIVIDVGAGTGLMLPALSKEVGEGGKVMAIDLSARFCSFMKERVQKLSLHNVEVSVCSNKSVQLPAVEADVAIICDVYHHFEYPRTYMRSLRKSLKKGGKVVVVDFHRDPKKMIQHPPQWALDHIRADQATFEAEIEESGFDWLASPDVPELKENYVMVFRSTRS